MQVNECNWENIFREKTSQALNNKRADPNFRSLQPQCS